MRAVTYHKQKKVPRQIKTQAAREILSPYPTPAPMESKRMRDWASMAAFEAMEEDSDHSQEIKNCAQ